MPAQRNQLLLVLGITGLLICGAFFPVTTRQGVDGIVTRHRIPLYLKVLQFLHQNSQLDYLSRDIKKPHSKPVDQVAAYAQWTHDHIRHPFPPGLPIVDDHVLNIIIRGYGTDDQLEDVFSTLATYGGFPAFWRQAHSSCAGYPDQIISFVRTAGKWAVVDASSGEMLLSQASTLAQLGQAMRTKAYETRLSGAPGPQEQWGCFADAVSLLEQPVLLRAEEQMPFKRMWYELQKVFIQR